ncbi:hypothetical protein WICPIJ_003816 [Wickerhamomyces pijperi]|uniref:Uncharacterized protein n=1 Tax=Wickerhamomyces pijperi TaxID=599730 RepID=A0A9P8Q766_WICPI|nr:hypothetical protein WICPIJ_003816 [Wickerhamomyces pijperi]
MILPVTVIGTSSPVKTLVPTLAPFLKEMTSISLTLRAAGARLMFSMANLTVSISLKFNSLLKTISGDSLVKRCFKLEMNGIARFMSLPTFSLIVELSFKDCFSNNSRTNSIFSVVVSGGLVVEQGGLQGRLVVGVVVVLVGVFDQLVQFVFEGRVEEVVLTCSVGVNVLHSVFGPFLQGGQTQDGSVGTGFFKVGIFNSVTGIGKSNTGGIGTELVHDLFQGQEVTRGLGHLVVVQ